MKFLIIFSIIEVEKNKFMYPNTIYENNYGGDPSEIPNLTNENLKNFHSNYYRPCNSMIYSYGKKFNLNDSK